MDVARDVVSLDALVELELGQFPVLDRAIIHVQHQTLIRERTLGRKAARTFGFDATATLRITTSSAPGAGGYGDCGFACKVAPAAWVRTTAGYCDMSRLAAKRGDEFFRCVRLTAADSAADMDDHFLA